MASRSIHAISRSSCVNSGWRSARRSSSRKHRAICSGGGGARCAHVGVWDGVFRRPQVCTSRLHVCSCARSCTSLRCRRGGAEEAAGWLPTAAASAVACLVVAVEPRHHEHLLEQLRRLRQRVPVARLQPAGARGRSGAGGGHEMVSIAGKSFTSTPSLLAGPATLPPSLALSLSTSLSLHISTHTPGWHQVVSRALWRGASEDGSLHLQEAVAVFQEAADAAHDGVAQAQVVGHARPPAGGGRSSEEGGQAGWEAGGRGGGRAGQPAAGWGIAHQAGAAPALQAAAAQAAHRRSSTRCFSRSSSRGVSAWSSAWLTRKGSLRVTAFSTCGREAEGEGGKTRQRVMRLRLHPKRAHSPPNSLRFPPGQRHGRERSPAACPAHPPLRPWG